MNSFEYYNPVKVNFSVGAIDLVGEEVKVYGKNALIVSYEDVSFLKNTIENIHKSLKENGVCVTELFNVTANPTLSQAKKGIALCKEKNIDVVIGLGGGSAMDCAKVISAGVYYEEDISKMIAYSHSKNSQIPPTKALPMIMIPTLPATGSEMNPTAVITDDIQNRKSYVWAPDCLYPKVAIMDPALTVGLPKIQTACGAIDTIAHITEAYFNGDNSNLDIQDRMQEGVITAVLENLPRVIENPGDLEARGVMMWAASIALNGWLLSGTYTWAPMHQMGHVLSARYNATHGATLACMMLAWLRFFSNHKDSKRYIQYAERIFGSSINEAADKFERYMKKYGVPTKISELGVKQQDIDELVEDVVTVSFNENGVLGSNPTLTKEEVKEIYTIALSDS